MRVEAFEQVTGAGLILFDNSIVTGGQFLGSHFLCVAKNDAKLNGGIASHARIWSLAALIGPGKIVDDFILKLPADIGYLYRYIQLFPDIKDAMLVFCSRVLGKA